jgi:hypothetical protein
MVLCDAVASNKFMEVPLFEALDKNCIVAVHCSIDDAAAIGKWADGLHLSYAMAWAYNPVL